VVKRNQPSTTVVIRPQLGARANYLN